jgi:CheY-like chemotaxis protein
MKILVVEDNEANRDMLVRRLQKRGYDVVEAVDGQQGVDMTISEQPGLILMDISLPVFDGLEATRRIKQSIETAHIPVVGLSAHALPEDRGRALEAGCDDYDTKPVDIKRLVSIINRYDK